MHWIEAGLLAAAFWLVRAYFWPHTQCWRCKGKKTNPGSTRKRYGLCKTCGGSGSRQVLGSKTVHRAVRNSFAFARRNRKG